MKTWKWAVAFAAAVALYALAMPTPRAEAAGGSVIAELQFDATANAQRVVECEPDLAVAPVTIAANAGGTASADVPAGRYELLVSGEQSNVRFAADCAATPALVTDRVYVTGTQRPVTVAAATKACARSAGAQGVVQFARCR